MNRTLIALATASLVTSMNTRAESPGALTPELLEDLRDGYEMDAGDRARHNAVTNAEINKLALNREIVAGEDGHFSHKIKTKGITNQKSSGRCWMFAGFNVMRPKVINELGLDGFEFSNAYLQFWDKMEKSNLYLEDIIELRDVDRLDREWLLVNEWLVGDGGWWNYVTGLISKYGAVPSSVMPETHSSENTSTMNKVLARLLHSQAAALIKAGEAGSGEEALRTMKKKSLKEIYRFLAINLGEPPTEFEWRYKVKSKDEKEGEMVEVADKNLTLAKKYTPQSFYKEFVGVDLNEFVCLYNDPSQEMNAHYRFHRARNIAGEDDMNFVNIEISQMKEIAVKSVLANQAMWFAVNMSEDQSREHGMMEVDLYDYETLFDVKLDLSKAERSRFGAGASNHAMVLTGVDLKEGKPTKWLVENSWGSEKGNKGRWTLYDDWFTEHVYTIIVHRKHVPKKTLAIFDEGAKVLPAWYPGAKGIDSK
ncbi:C1 family peptidase [Akkermansiaceae bacterium]|nr:C1 family peptidase [Akkermansiaceae bacterium]MDB2429123.1 C1 family peptidase [Akkermansiaceae bacterium]